MKKAILSLSVIVLLTTSCKKEKDENAAITPTKENLTGSYMLSNLTAKYGSAEEQPAMMVVESCMRDDIHKLNADNSYEIVDAGEKCDTDDTDTWSLTNASTLIMNDMMYTIRKFDGKALELVLDLGNGGSMIWYYTKQ